MKTLLMWMVISVLAVVIPGTQNLTADYSGQDLVYLVEANKDSKMSYFAKFVTETKQFLVVDDVPEYLADHAVPFIYEPKYTYFIVELSSPAASTMPGELVRLDRFAILGHEDPELLLLVKHRYEDTIIAFSQIQIEQLIDPELLPPQNTVLEDYLMRETTLLKRRAPRVESEWLKDMLSKLSGATPVQINGKTHTISDRATKENKSLARNWLRQEYESLGYRVTEAAYGSGINFIAEKRAGKSDQFLIVSSHLDTVHTAGADDDGSGTISALAIAKALHGKTLKHSIRFVAFDEEELGLKGSQNYAKALDQAGHLQKLIGVLNIEMTGYDADKDGAFHVIDCNENSSSALTTIVLDSVKQQNLALKKTAACTNRSDHASFWAYDRPAVVVSQNFFGGDSNPCYHRSCDQVTKIDFSYMTKLTQALTGAVFAVVVE